MEKQTEKKTAVKSDKRSTMLLIAIALIVLGAVFIYIALGQPKISHAASDAGSGETSVSSAENTTVTNNENAYKADLQCSGNSSVPAVSYPLNLNTCTVQELMQIDGIGETRANAILAYREHIGGYTSVEQIKNISGISDGIYNSIAPYLTV